MKRILFFLLLGISVFCHGQKADFSIKESVKKFPDTVEGVLLEHVYVFTNTGKEPLFFDDYSVGCKCTEVYLPEGPILPGKQGKIRVTFDTNGKAGFQNRTVYLVTNTRKKVEKLRFKVNVIPKS